MLELAVAFEKRRDGVGGRAVEEGADDVLERRPARASRLTIGKKDVARSVLLVSDVALLFEQPKHARARPSSSADRECPRAPRRRSPDRAGR